MYAMRYCLLAVTLISLCSALAQEKIARTVWDGVYTAAQANRGEAIYNRSCAGCHGEDLTKSGNVLRGAKFLNQWREDSLQSLFATLKATMPRNAPQSLPDTQYVDVVAYLLQENSFPAAADELRLESLDRIRVIGKDGPEPAPNFSLVSVTGCLAETAPNAWALKNASEPVRTRNPKESSEVEVTAAKARPAGGHTFGLMDMINFPRQAQAGHWMEAKGLLIREAGNDRLNLTWLAKIDENCR